MKKILQKYKGVLFLLCLVFIQSELYAQAPPPPSVKMDTVPEVAQQDTIPMPYKFSKDSDGGLFLKLPTMNEVVYDLDTKRYVILEKIGNTVVKKPLFMSTTEYTDFRLKDGMKNYFQEKISALNSDKEGSKEAQKDLLPTYYVKSKLFETIFGSNKIEVNTQGSIDVRLGALYQNIENPQLSEENRSSFNFDFDQQVTASIAAKVGERLKVTANYDTKASFDFQNLVKIEFLQPIPTGHESNDNDDIVRKIELGNVSMDVSNNLITGAQSLFGVKTELQFGKTKVTAVLSQQKSQTKTVSAEGGSALNEFELQTSQYAANQHFFLAHYFRNNYNKALKQFPLISSNVNITNIEVWITNRSTNTTDVRNIVALTDLGESGSDIYDPSKSNIINGEVTPTNAFANPDNSSNSLSAVLENAGIREIGTVKNTLPASMVQGTDYTVLENAKKLGANEFDFHPQLGILSLNRQLTDGDVLAVAFQYTFNGSDKVYKVGELSTDGRLSSENIVLKLLRSELIQTNNRIWDLMMKNVYSLGAYQMQSEGFRLDLMYKDDKTGVAINTLQNAKSTYDLNGETITVSDRSLLNLVKLDSLDQNNFVKPKGDGYFDFVEGVTVKSENGTIIFPTVEPFGRDLEAKLTHTDDANFLFKELYTNTQTNARNNYQTRDKFLLKGYYKADASSGISLGAFNVPKGSVKVTSNGILLTEGADYVVDYLSGRVQIINPAIEASGAPVQVSLENNTLFNQQTKSYVGIDVEHKFSDKFQMTGTYLNVNERPITQKASFGADPINNTMLGLTMNYNSEVPFFTKLVNKLPFQDTDVASNFSIRSDFAYLKPGTPSGVNQDGEATTYIDDFEGSQIPIGLMDVSSWKLASKPLNNNGQFDFGSEENEDLDLGKKRAKLAWYTIDQIFLGNSSLKPSSITNEEQSRVEVSRVEYKELFPETNLDITQTTSLRTFDLAYYPNEKGSYNYATNAELEANVEKHWGGITRALTTTDFERANVEYIQFWIQDPHLNYSINATEGKGATGEAPKEEGELYFNLGNISEDVLKDGKKMFENGLPEANDPTAPEETVWGNIPTNKSFLYTFNEVDADRLAQDVGLDGMSDAAEQARHPGLGEDPSSDNYRFFRGKEYDTEKATILKRYKDYNNTEGNSPTSNLSTENFPTSATSVPDAEDVNKDQTMNTIDAYYQYKISLKQSDLVVGKGFLVDAKDAVRKMPDGKEVATRWYQFRVPITSGEAVNGISGYNSIRFMRMFVTNYTKPVVLRFGQLQLVRGDWRRYTKNVHGGLQVESDNLDETDFNNFSAGVVNFEENETRVPIPYVLPPGIVREQLQSSTYIQFQNEQSLSVKVDALPKGEARGVYKNTITDLRMYKRLKMFIHAEGRNNINLSDDKLSAIIRIGSDLNENFYQIEVPLKATLFSNSSAEEIWPEENNLEVDLEALGKLKLERYQAFGATGVNELYPLPVEDEAPAYRVRVKGNPNLANIKTIMMGVKNISDTPQSAEIWFNELRVAGFDNEGGWATVVSANANFADLAEVAVTGRMQSMGFGNVEQRVNERSQEEIKQYGISTNVNVGQLMPKNWGVKIPMSYSVSEEFKDPKYDPQFQDVRFEDAKDINENSANAQDYTKRKSINFINVRKERVGELKKIPMPYDIENFSVSYSYNEQFHKDYNVQKHLVQDVRSSASYAYTIKSKPIEPFKNIGFIKKSKYLKLIKDFNFYPLPSTIGVNSNITRNYNEQLSRNLVPGLSELPTLKQRNFLFDWDYSIGYNLTKALKFNFRAANKHIYDRFETDDSIDEDEIGLFSNFFNFGRVSNYSQKLDATYKLPIDKLPYLSFVTADYSYTANFDWQAGPLSKDADGSLYSKVGNSIQNANTQNLTTNLNMSKFYKEIGLQKLFLAKKKSTKKATKKGDKPKFAQAAPKRSISSSKKKKSTKQKILDLTYDLVTAVKSVKVGYTENNGTQLQGYTPKVGFLGRNSYGDGLAPSFGFVFGDQSDIRDLALERNWLIARNVQTVDADGNPIEDESYYSKNYAQTHYNKLDVNMSVKPFKDLDINISANRIRTRNISEQIDPTINGRNTFDTSDDIYEFGPSQLSEVGSFSMSYNMIATSFDGNGDATFDKFIDNISVIQQRLTANLEANNPGAVIDGYKGYSQDVLLPAFTAAYSGNDAKTEGLKPFKNVPLPNWRVTYKGLMKLKWVKKNFSSFTISHAYKSAYTLGNYSNNLQYGEVVSTEPLRNAPKAIPLKDSNNNYFSKNIIANISLNDGFSPLIKVDLKLKNSMSFRGEVKKDRTLSLNFNNNTLSDIRGTEYIFGLGYVIKDLKMRSRLGGKLKTLKGNLNMKADISYRQNANVIRTIDTENNQITGGQDIFSLKVSADYNLSKNLIATFYYDQSASKYAISTSFPRQSISTGVSITYNLGN
ncbi:T9SS outer membrane translocon Sov/SprA [Flavicella sediminum]|uniref:T9SS outer membrane translocon Sov/SprA n=1 Tax=Flavicella sediminum TaxID=2585141 RepID=UPI001FB7EA50|nr:cell surface protein SprA [Flavicella sediminum]